MSALIPPHSPATAASLAGLPSFLELEITRFCSYPLLFRFRPVPGP